MHYYSPRHAEVCWGFPRVHTPKHKRSLQQKHQRCQGMFQFHTAFFGAFAKLRKATISFVMSVCPSVRVSVRPHETTWIPPAMWKLLISQLLSKVCWFSNLKRCCWFVSSQVKSAYFVSCEVKSADLSARKWSWFVSPQVKSTDFSTVKWSLLICQLLSEVADLWALQWGLLIFRPSSEVCWFFSS
jgi:hypothetical protein